MIPLPTLLFYLWDTWLLPRYAQLYPENTTISGLLEQFQDIFLPFNANCVKLLYKEQLPPPSSMISDAAGEGVGTGEARATKQVKEKKDGKASGGPDRVRGTDKKK